jgi:hypothetical protein
VYFFQWFCNIYKKSIIKKKIAIANNKYYMKIIVDYYNVY